MPVGSAPRKKLRERFRCGPIPGRIHSPRAKVRIRPPPVCRFGLSDAATGASIQCGRERGARRSVRWVVGWRRPRDRPVDPKPAPSGAYGTPRPSVVIKCGAAYRCLRKYGPRETGEDSGRGARERRPGGYQIPSARGTGEGVGHWGEPSGGCVNSGYDGGLEADTRARGIAGGHRVARPRVRSGPPKTCPRRTGSTIWLVNADRLEGDI